jgi:hypothetical protein
VTHEFLPDIPSLTAQIVIVALVIGGTLWICHLRYQKQQLTRTVQQYEATFQKGEFPKRIQFLQAPDPKPVFEIHRLDDTKAGDP